MDEKMLKTGYDMLYLVTCALRGDLPEKSRMQTVDMEMLYKISRYHSLSGIVAYALESVGIKDENFQKDKNVAIRNIILFDAERKSICKLLEENKIWYMPLKGVYLKEYYPKIGMRQMCDNDILVDNSRIKDVDVLMKNRGYCLEDKTEEEHDQSYQKKPCYNFEMHKTLVGDYNNVIWYEYYKDIKDKLQKDTDNLYGYHFTNEDFYVFMRLHEYKHFSVGGIGLRSLTDVYVFMKKFKDQLDWNYITNECEKLGIAEFDKKTRKLVEEIFGSYDLRSLRGDSLELLNYYLGSGTYGTASNFAKNRIEKIKEETGHASYSKYFFQRIFPPMEVYRVWYPFFYKHKILLPIGWAYRLIRGIFCKQSMIRSELSVIGEDAKSKTE